MTTTYDELFQDLQDWTENPGSEFQQAIPRIIRNTETRIYREVDLISAWKIGSEVLTPGQLLVPKPADAVAIRSVKWEGSAGSGANVLDHYGHNVIDEYYAGGVASGPPRMWADQTETQITICPPADTAGTLYISYTFRPAGLSPTNQTTWLSLNAANVLLYGCLVEAGIFLKQRSNSNGEGMKKVYYEKYNEEIALLRAEEMRKGNNAHRSGEKV